MVNVCSDILVLELVFVFSDLSRWCQDTRTWSAFNFDSNLHPHFGSSENLEMNKYFLTWSWRRNLHIPVLIGLEIIIVLLYAFYVRFDSPLSQERWNTLNPLFNDVHVMVFLGIAFILTFLNNYSITAVCFNFLIGALSVQWYILGPDLVASQHDDIICPQCPVFFTLGTTAGMGRR